MQNTGRQCCPSRRDFSAATYQNWAQACFGRIMASKRPTDRLSRFFSGVAEHTFQTELGVVDPPLVDYLSRLLLRFVRHDLVRPLDSSGRRFRILRRCYAKRHFGSAMLSGIHCQIGDFALFWVSTRIIAGEIWWTRRHSRTAFMGAELTESLPGWSLTTVRHLRSLDRLAERFELCVLSSQFVGNGRGMMTPRWGSGSLLK